MQRQIKYPSISQFRQIVKEITERACFIGLDEEGKAEFDYCAPKPVVDFSITTKIHGTNAGYVYTKDYQYHQSRENIITLEKDNMSCAFMMQNRKEIFNELCENILKYYNLDDTRYGIILYMELCGKGVQKGVGVSELEKMFILFEHSLIVELETFEKVKWVKTNIFNQ